MRLNPDPQKTEDYEPEWRITALVGATSLALFLFFASGYVQTIDVAQSIAVSQRIGNDRTVSIVGFPEIPGGGAVKVGALAVAMVYRFSWRLSANRVAAVYTAAVTIGMAAVRNVRPTTDDSPPTHIATWQ